LNDAFNREIPTDQRDQLNKVYVNPEYVPFVSAPRIPEVIWNNVTRFDRMIDAKY